MNIYEILDKEKFSAGEKALINLIKDDPDTFIAMDTDAIAARAHVSRSTIYRLAEKTQSGGLSAFKLRLANERRDYDEVKKDFDFNYPIRGGENGHKIASVIKDDYAATVQATRNLLDYRALHLAAKWIRAAVVTDIYAAAGNICFADNFRFQMSEIGLNVNVEHEYYQMRLCAARSDSSHTGIIISFGGRSTGIESICRCLKENGEKIILIGSQEANKLGKYADLRLMMPTGEDHYRKISSFSTRVSLLYILDILYTVIFALDYERNLKIKTDYYEKMTRT